MSVKRISDLDIANRGLLSGIYGNTRNSEYFIDNDLCAYNISEALYLYLKSEGYRVVFYNPTDDIGFYSYSEEDLAIFSGYAPVATKKTPANDSARPNMQSDNKYARQGDQTSYIPKMKTPMGKMKPRFGPRTQQAASTTTASLPTTLAQEAMPKRGNNLMCHYPQIYLHVDGQNTFFKRYSSINVFDDVFGFSKNHPEERLVVVFENPENIIPPHPDQVENKFNEISKVYGKEHRQLKLIVLFGYRTSGQLAAAFDREHSGENGVFFRTSFATRFGLAVSNQSNELNRIGNIENYKANVFFVDLPQEDEVGNWLIRKRILEGATCTLSPKPFETLVRSIANGNFKMEHDSGKLTFATTEDRMILTLNKPTMNLEKIVSTVNADAAYATLCAMDGMQNVVNQITSLKNLIINARQQKEETGRSTITVYPHMAFVGNPGTGKTTVAQLVAQWFREENVLSKGTFVSATVGDLIGQYVGETRIKTQALCERAKGGLLFIDEAYGLRAKKSDTGSANYEAEAVEVLIQYMTKPDFMVVLAGYKHEIDDLLDNGNPGLKSRITPDQRIVFEDYQPEILIKILQRNLTYPQTEEFQTAIRMLVEVMYAQRNLRTWGNARAMEQLAAQIYKEFFAGNDRVLDVCHIPAELMTMINTQVKSEKEVMLGLNSLVGLHSVKQMITALYRKMRRNRLRMKEGLPVKEEDMIFVFKGAPGTGKTTVARMLGGILHNLGMLNSDELVEVKKGDIVSQYAGGTEEKIEDLFASNVGKTIFIDEAYSLCENGNTSIITQLVGLLTDPRYKGKLALVFAGYPAEMDRFLSMNVGMKRRMKHIIQFDNYSNEELLDILLYNMRKLNRSFSDAEQCHRLALAWFGMIPRTADFGNASVSEQLLELLDLNNDQRLSSLGIEDVAEFNLYRPEDFPELAHEALANNLSSGNASSESNTNAASATQPSNISIDLSGEADNMATNVEHLEYSVGLLTTSTGQEEATGTAFVISTHNRYILTCSHVVEGATRFMFSINALNFETPAQLLWNNPQCDMALLQVDNLPDKAMYLALCHEVKPITKTTKITLAGYPLGEMVSHNLMVNSGEITNYEANKQNNDRCFDTYMSDINATHGNSGGPVVRQSDYQVIGLLQGGFEQVQVRLITDIQQLNKHIEIINK